MDIDMDPNLRDTLLQLGARALYRQTIRECERAAKAEVIREYQDEINARAQARVNAYTVTNEAVLLRRLAK